MAGKRGVKHERHGHYGSPEYRSWAKMIARCTCETDRAWPDYGGRGIKVCDRWRTSFLAFLEDVGFRPTPKHTIERIQNHLGYEPGNCRWATRAEQNRNTRKNRTITLGDQTMLFSDWARILGRSSGDLFYRLKTMPIEQALQPKWHSDARHSDQASNIIGIFASLLL